jgi:GNAT superfamily N-acetyltransferase
MFDGIASPATQTFGLGMFETATDACLETVEQFYRYHGAAPLHEVSPLAGKELALLLSARGYEPFEFTSVMYLPLADTDYLQNETNPNVSVRVVTPNDADCWVATSVRGWSEYVEYAGVMADLARVAVTRADGLSFLAELDGRPVATAAVCMHDRVVLMAGASTIPEARNRGAQRALLASRLHYAAASGCDLAMMGAEPGSASQRNAERVGFRIAYTRMKWRLR